MATVALAVMPTALAGTDGQSCFDQLSVGHSPSVAEWRQRGSTVERRALPQALRGHSLLVRLEENSVDVEAEVFDNAETLIAQSDSPVERRASQYLYLPAGIEELTLVAEASEPATVNGTVRVAFLAVDAAAFSAGTAEDCFAALRKWAEGDMAYARGRFVTFGQAPGAAPGNARTAFEAGASAYKEALQRLPRSAHSSERGQLELALAALSYYGLKDWSGSADWAGKAAATFVQTGERYRRARAQAIEAAAWIELATKSAAVTQTAQTPAEATTRLSAARALLAQLSEFHAARHESYDQALQLNNIGLAYLDEARFESAIPYFSQAERQFKRLGDNTHVALALQNIALCDWGAGRLSAALTKFDDALQVMPATAHPNRYLIAMTLYNSGLAHYAAGHFDESLRLQTQAMDLATRIQSDPARVRSDYGLGVTYYALGERELAAEFLRRGLELSNANVDSRTRVAMLRALAQIEYETGSLADATRHDSEALRLATASSARARILLRLAEDYAAAGDTAGSRTILDELISHPPNHDELVRAMGRVQRGRLLRLAGATRPAQQDLTQALQTLDHLDSLAQRFEARFELAGVYADQGRTDEALAVLRRALRYSREMREQTANPEYRASIVGSLRPAVSLEVDLLRAEFTTLMQQGRTAEAEDLADESLAAVDRDRASGFQEWRSEYFEQHSDTELARLVSLSSTLYHDMAERRYQLTVREDRGGTEDPRARALREDIARIRVRLGLIDSEIAERSGGTEDGSAVNSPEAAVASIERVLEPGQAVIEYWLGSSRAYAWVLRNASIDWVELGPTREIQLAARKLHEAMHSPATAPAAQREACQELYRLVVTPVSGSLSTAHELMIVPDGSLHYVPFAALRDPARSDKSYLVQSFSLSIAPSLRFLPKATGATRSTRTAADASRALIVADPIYAADDPRLGSEGRRLAQEHPTRNDPAEHGDAHGLSALPRLESTAREASQIDALLGAEHVDLLQGAEATRDSVLAKDLASYRFIHIASHGVIDAEIPQLSSLILGTYGSSGPVADPYLRAADLLTRTFHAQAIVLSACDTALGKEYPSEGLIGLRYAALARGAQAVVASLWPVADATAATLMTSMYREILAAGENEGGQTRGGDLRVARALATAMRQELARSPGLDPALWAPFSVYIGGD